jgi:hypothetical protein
VTSPGNQSNVVGDYTATEPDPSRPQFVWGTGEFQTPLEWRTWAARYVFDCPTDWDQSGAIDSGDSVAIIDMYLASDPWIDMDDNGVVELTDCVAALAIQNGG